MNSYKKHPLIIAGSRNIGDGTNDIKMIFREVKKFCRELNVKPSELQVVSGTAKGVDKAGEFLADYLGSDIKRYAPDWDKHGQVAGFIRNEQMALYTKKMSGSCILFWDGNSKGTLHMIEMCKKYEINYRLILTEGYWEREKD